jgi:hypothetical protein
MWPFGKEPKVDCCLYLTCRELLDTPDAEVRIAIQEAVASGVGVVFKWALPVIILAFLVSFLLREVPLRNDVNVRAAAVEGMEEAGFGMLGEPGPPGLDDGHTIQEKPAPEFSAP